MSLHLSDQSRAIGLLATIVLNDVKMILPVFGSEINNNPNRCKVSFKKSIWETFGNILSHWMGCSHKTNCSLVTILNVASFRKITYVSVVPFCPMLLIW